MTDAYTPEDRQDAWTRLGASFERSPFAKDEDILIALFWTDPELQKKGRKRLGEEVRLAEGMRYLYWALLDADLCGRTWVRLFLEKEGATLPEGQRTYLTRAAASCLSLYEAEEVVPESGMRITDLWTGKSVWIGDSVLNAGLAAGDLVAGRLVEGPRGEPALEWDLYYYAAKDKEAILRRLDERYQTYLAHGPGGRMDFYKRHGNLFHGLWVEHMLLPYGSKAGGRTPVAPGKHRWRR